MRDLMQRFRIEVETEAWGPDGLRLVMLSENWTRASMAMSYEKAQRLAGALLQAVRQNEKVRSLRRVNTPQT